jgi:hypothetical protein
MGSIYCRFARLHYITFTNKTRDEGGASAPTLLWLIRNNLLL